MSGDLNAEDTETLRLKLRTVDQWIAAYESQAGWLLARVSTQAFVEEAPKPQRLLEILRDAAVPIVEVGASQSLVAEDLATTSVELGADHQQTLAQIQSSLSARAARVLQRESLGLTSDQIVQEVVTLAEDVVRLVEAGLAPAKWLRDRLIEELRERRRADMRRDRTLLRQKRDQRIRELKREHPTASLNELANIARLDGRVVKLGERVSKDIVRQALSRRQTRSSQPRDLKSKCGFKASSRQANRGKKRE